MVGLMSRSMCGGADQQGWRKGPWTSEEDKLLSDYVTHRGDGRWSSVSRSAGLNRSGKSCRLRWVNYLRPGLKRGQITPQEEGIIIELHALWGNKWSTIARYLPGRTDNEIKNYWRTHFKKRDRLPSRKIKPQKSQTQKEVHRPKQIIPHRKPLQQGEVVGETVRLTTSRTDQDIKISTTNYAAIEDCHFGQLINYPNNQDATNQEDFLWSGSLWSFNDSQGARDKAPMEQNMLCRKVANLQSQATLNDFNGLSWWSGDYANYNMLLHTDDSIFWISS